MEEYKKKTFEEDKKRVDALKEEHASIIAEPELKKVSIITRKIRIIKWELTEEARRSTRQIHQ